MRVIAGKAKGRNLLSVPGDTTRPIMDRVKTALFDILRPTLPAVRMLDLFGGSGAVGIEALSQGAEHCTFTELSDKAVGIIKKNLEATGLNTQAEVRHTDAFKFLRNTSQKFDLIYIAPPQYKNLWVEAMHIIAEGPELVTQNGRIIVQIDPSEYEKLSLNDFDEVSERKYGRTLLLFYHRKNATLAV